MTRHLTAGEARRCLAHLPPTPEAYAQALRLRFPDAWVPRHLIEVLLAERGPRPQPPAQPPLIPARLSVPGPSRVRVSTHVQASWRAEPQAESVTPPPRGWASQDAPRPRPVVPSLIQAYEEGQRSGGTWSSWRERHEVPPLPASGRAAPVHAAPVRGTGTEHQGTGNPVTGRSDTGPTPGRSEDEERHSATAHWGEPDLDRLFGLPAPHADTAGAPDESRPDEAILSRA